MNETTAQAVPCGFDFCQAMSAIIRPLHTGVKSYLSLFRSCSLSDVYPLTPCKGDFPANWQALRKVTAAQGPPLQQSLVRSFAVHESSPSQGVRGWVWAVTLKILDN